MNFQRFIVAGIALALALPSAPAVSGSLTVRLCGGGTVTLPIERDTPPPSPDHGCCKGVCHFGDDRRKRRDGVELPCH